MTQAVASARASSGHLRRYKIFRYSFGRLPRQNVEDIACRLAPEPMPEGLTRDLEEEGKDRLT